MWWQHCDWGRACLCFFQCWLYRWIIIALSNLCSVTTTRSVYFRSRLPRVLWGLCWLSAQSSREMCQASVRELVSDWWLLQTTPRCSWQTLDNTTRELILFHLFPTRGNWTISCFYCRTVEREWQREVMTSVKQRERVGLDTENLEFHQKTA